MRTSNIVVGCTFIFYYIVLCFGITLTWRFHNIFIVHGKGHGKHTNVGCTMVGLCGVEIMSQLLLKAWCLRSMEKIKDSKVRHVVLDCLHMVMFMSINLDETIDDFKEYGSGGGNF